MGKTPGERAHSAFEKNCTFGQERPSLVNYLGDEIGRFPHSDACEKCTQAIREAEDAAYERAAEICADETGYYFEDDVANLIRALTHKD